MVLIFTVLPVTVSQTWPPGITLSMKSILPMAYLIISPAARINIHMALRKVYRDYGIPNKRISMNTDTQLRSKCEMVLAVGLGVRSSARARTNCRECNRTKE